MEYQWDRAIWHGGPDWKVWASVNAVAGVCLHSAEGYESGMWDVLFSDAQASWHFSVLKDGRVFQHYPLDSSPWHAGSRAQNERLVGVEHEGVAGEPLTDSQLTASIALVQWIAKQGGWLARRGDSNQTLFAHSDIYQTACPSGRIPFERYIVPAAVLLPRNQEMFVEESDVQTVKCDPVETDAVMSKVWKHYIDVRDDVLGGGVERIVSGRAQTPGVTEYVVRVPD